jgi:hypothetical protein
MQYHFKLFTPSDALFIVSLLVCAVFFLPYMHSHEPAAVIVYRDNQEIAKYPLNTDQDFEIKGKTGPMKIRIEHNQVRVLSATCPEHLCVKTRPIKKIAQQIVCEPNHIVIEINSKKQNDLDAVSR